MGLLGDIGWASADADSIEPDAGRKSTGWAPAEKPPAQYFNWIWRQFSLWQKQFKLSTPLAVVGSVGGLGVTAAPGCTHATVALALADAAVVAGSKIYLTESANLAALQAVSKANIVLEGAPGATLTKTGGTTGLSLDAAGITIRNIRFAGYTVGGNKAIACTANGLYARILFCNFAVGTDTEVDDSLATAGKRPVVVGCITEV